MATTEVDVYNLALSSIGTKSVVALAGENTVEARACARWYDEVRDTVLRAAHWPSCKAYSRLALAATRDDTLEWTTGDPEPGYKYAYSYPSNMLAPRYLSDYSPFTLGLINANVPAIMTNKEDALLFYSFRQTNVQLWDVSLLMAISFALGAHIALQLTGKPARSQRAAELANQKILEARAAVANADGERFESVPDWFTARGYGSTPPTRYIYPYGSLIQAPGVVGVS